VSLMLALPATPDPVAGAGQDPAPDVKPTHVHSSRRCSAGLWRARRALSRRPGAAWLGHRAFAGRSELHALALSAKMPGWNHGAAKTVRGVGPGASLASDRSR